jgi:hypothetical protein
MTLSALPTLAYIRGEVLQRCGINTGANRGARASLMADTCIRQATVMLQIECPWTRLQVTRQIPMQLGLTLYDFPDDVDAGDIGFIGVHNITSQKVLELSPDPDWSIRNALVNVTLSRPRFYYFEQETVGASSSINILPSPDTSQWDYLVVTGYMNPGLMVADTDVIGFDGEAVMQRAEILARPRFGLDVDGELKTNHTKYLDHLRARQGDGEGLLLGGATSDKCRPERGGGNRGFRRAWDTGWNPNGDWGS